MVFFTIHFSSFLPVLYFCYRQEKKYGKIAAAAAVVVYVRRVGCAHVQLKIRTFSSQQLRHTFSPFLPIFQGLSFLCCLLCTLTVSVPCSGQQGSDDKSCDTVSLFPFVFVFIFPKFVTVTKKMAFAVLFHHLVALLTETMANGWICHSFFTSFYVEHELEIFYSRPTKDLQIQALS